MEETWKDIQGFENFYQISNLGQTKSLNRISSQNCLIEEKILKNITNTSGYSIVSLYKDGKQKNVKIHRLVAQAFIPNPENKPQVNHKNGIKADNRVENLEWATAKENIKHAFKTGLKQAFQGESHPMSTLTQSQVSEIRNLYLTEKFSVNDLTKIFGVAAGVIRSILRGDTWKSSLNLNLQTEINLLRRKNCYKNNREKPNGAKVSKEQVREIRRLFNNENLNIRQLAQRFNIGESGISHIVSYRTWKHI